MILLVELLQKFTKTPTNSIVAYTIFESSILKHFKTISEYCKAINIAAPKYPHFDIRRFKDNMSSVVNTMLPFRHEFYAIAVKYAGKGSIISGHYNNFPNGYTIFFNSPFQILSWDIKPNWEGFYVMFSQEFIITSSFLKDILVHFPFLKIEKDMPFEIVEDELKSILIIYEFIELEYNSNKPDKFQLIESYVLLLLNITKRYFQNNISKHNAIAEIRKANLKLLSRFQTLIETHFQNNASQQLANVHTTNYYAQKLHIHPNHLNAIVKEITGITAKQYIQKHILNLAKSLLVQSSYSIKEIAYLLHFETPNNFSAFFKKMTSKSPSTYRKALHL